MNGQEKKLRALQDALLSDNLTPSKNVIDNKRTPHDPQKLHEIIFESKQRHGHGHRADRAHLEEMLARDDIPQFLRGHMQNALNRHLHSERMEAHNKFMSKVTT